MYTVRWYRRFSHDPSTPTNEDIPTTYPENLPDVARVRKSRGRIEQCGHWHKASENHHARRRGLWPNPGRGIVSGYCLSRGNGAVSGNSVGAWRTMVSRIQVHAQRHQG